MAARQGPIEAGEAVEELAAARAPLLIGVRHHSPVLAAAVPALLDAASPDALLVELPAELDGWTGWLGDPATRAPVALAVAAGDGRQLGFYPFADFSPELAAIRWAVGHGVPVHAIDLPAALMATLDGGDGGGEGGGDPGRGGRDGDHGRAADHGRAGHGEGRRGVVAALVERFQADGTEELWDRLVEVPSYGASPERVRRAALALGWAMRVDAATGAGVDRRDLIRESWMRRRVAEVLGRGATRPAAVVGAFHAAALLPRPDPALSADPGWAEPGWAEPGVEPGAGAPAGVAAALVPYTFELLDSRSGYPAGIRDPVWQQAVWEARGDPELVERAAARLVVDLCARLRDARHVAGVPDAREALRLARDLARLRGMAAPGRRELIEAVQSALGHGEPLGRGRALARAAQAVLVGDRRGALPRGVPRGGLAVRVEALLDELRLPGPSGPPGEVGLRLEPARSPLDRRRHVTLCRLRALGVPYGTEREVTGAGGMDALGRSWTVAWSPTVAATLELATVGGLSLGKAAEGALRRRRARLLDADELTPSALLALVAEAAECGLGDLVDEEVAAMRVTLLPSAGLTDLIAAHTLLRRIDAGHIPGLPAGRARRAGPEPSRPPAGPTLAELVAAAIASVEGLAGSGDLADAAALLQLVQLVTGERGERGAAGEGRLAWTLTRIARDGSALMQGAAGAALVLLDHGEPARFGARLASWVEAAPAGDGARLLAGRLQGALTLAAPLLEVAADLLDPLAASVEGLPDEAFLARLPALREGFDVLSPAARQRFLQALAARLAVDDPAELERHLATSGDRRAAATLAAADAAGRDALEHHDPGLLGLPGLGSASAGRHARPARPVPAGGDLGGDPGGGPGGDPGGGQGVGSGGRPATGGAGGGPAAGPSPRPASAFGNAIAPVDRWRLVLGREPDRLPAGLRRAARALDELYGRGHGEGSRALDPAAGRRGGDQAPFPTARDWIEELEALFGARVRDEVLARAAARGRTDALLAVDPETVTPSVELLQHVLELRGALPDAKLERLRRLVDRVVAELVRELAQRLRPALTGLATPRPTRQPRGPIDLPRTVRANLHTARRAAGGGHLLVPERPVFRTRARRGADWHVSIVVDVSGSMEASTIHSALVAAILNGLPALSVRFIAFSTEVVDLSGHVADPLGLLMEVSVGGGTDIGRGLAYARERLTVPRRSIVVLVSDFEEGVSVGRLLAEVRALAESGAHLLGLAALDDHAQPVFNRGIAEQVSAAGMPVAALSPLELARWIGEKVRG